LYVLNNRDPDSTAVGAVARAGAPCWRLPLLIPTNSSSLGLDLVHLGRRDLVRALERGPLVVVRHAISYRFLATVRAPKSMWV
jgi:hypothetical protein